jgi:hypothetical protein
MILVWILAAIGALVVVGVMAITLIICYLNFAQRDTGEDYDWGRHRARRKP